MYVPALNCILVEAPKTGTTTMRKALEGKYGKLPLPGHLRESQMIEWLGSKGIKPDYSVAVWRDPIARFLSAFLHTYAGWPDMDQALDHVLRGNRAKQRMFLPQVHFLDGDIDRRVFNFPPADALRFFGVEAVPHENESVKRWSLWDMKHRLEEIEAFVSDDLEAAWH